MATSSDNSIHVRWTALIADLVSSSATGLFFPKVNRMSLANSEMKDMWRIPLGVYVVLPEVKAKVSGLWSVET